MASTPEERKAARAERQTARTTKRSKIKAARNNKDLNYAQRRSTIRAAQKGMTTEEYGKTKAGLRLGEKSTRIEARNTKRTERKAARTERRETRKTNTAHMAERKASGDYSGSDLAYFNMARQNKNMKPRDYYAKYVK